MGWVWGDCGLGEGLSGLWLDDCGLGMGDCGWFAHPVGRQVEQEEMPTCELVRVCVRVRVRGGGVSVCGGSRTACELVRGKKSNQMLVVVSDQLVSESVRQT